MGGDCGAEEARMGKEPKEDNILEGYQTISRVVVLALMHSSH